MMVGWLGTITDICCKTFFLGFIFPRGVFCLHWCTARPGIFGFFWFFLSSFLLFTSLFF